MVPFSAENQKTCLHVGCNVIKTQQIFSLTSLRNGVPESQAVSISSATVAAGIFGGLVVLGNPSGKFLMDCFVL